MRKDLSAAYSDRGRPGIPPEQLLKAMLLRAIYAIPSDRRLSSNDHFTVDGTLARSLASHQSVERPREREDGKAGGKDDDASDGAPAAKSSGTPSRGEPRTLR